MCGLAIFVMAALPLTQFAGHSFGPAAGGTGAVVAAAHGELSHHNIPVGQAGHEAETHCGVSGCLVTAVRGAQGSVDYNDIRFTNAFLLPLGVTAGHEPPPPRFS